MSTLTAPSRRGKPAATILGLALLAALSLPAMAADPPCLDSNGNPTGASTDQGHENAGGENATCHPTASAFGRNNRASGQDSSAVGSGNIARWRDSRCSCVSLASAPDRAGKLS